MRVLIESGSFTGAYVTFATDIDWIAESKCFRASSDLSILHEWLIIIERSIHRRYSDHVSWIIEANRSAK